jgi:hypothetical protein
MSTPDDRIQRALNEQKKRELEQRYGAQFSWSSNNLPPEAEGEWLDYISEFERQYAANGQISVREFVGNPEVRPLTAIPPEEIADAADALLDLLQQNNIVIEFDREVSNAEVYRFITEELLNEKMDNIRIDQMMHTFVYDEFHPDEATHVRHTAEMFLNALFFRDRHIIWRMLSRKQVTTGTGGSISAEEFMRLLEGFYKNVPSFASHMLEIIACELDTPQASVTASLTWAGTSRDRNGPIGASGIAEVKFMVNPGGEWDVMGVKIPGMLNSEL